MIEEIIRQKIGTFQQYKEEVVKSLESIKSSQENMEIVLRNFERDRKKTLFWRKLDQIIFK